MKSKDNESGFEDYPAFPWQESRTQCPDSRHDPPGMMVVPDGKRYKHTCPTCGKVSYIYPSEARLGKNPQIWYNVVNYGKPT